MGKGKYGWLQEFLDKNSDVKIQKKNLKNFFYWMYERQNIWHRRFVLKQQAPWTKNKYMKDRKFTNVYRELDRNSIWQINNVINKKTTKLNKFFQIVITRMINNPETFEEIGIPTSDNFNNKKFFKAIERRRKRGDQVFTNAYLINVGKKGRTRNDHYANYVFKKFHERCEFLWEDIQASKHPETVMGYLTNCLDSCGKFIAYEIWCDLAHAKLIPWTTNDYVNIGPGCRVGLALLFPSLWKDSKRLMKKLWWLRDNEGRLFEKHSYWFHYLHDKGLSLREIEHSLCEYQKYYKMKIGEGRQRLHFKPRKPLKGMVQ